MKKQNTNAYIFTRPLQYLNIKGVIGSKYLEDNNVLYVFANFNYGQQFCNDIIKHEKIWSKVIFISSKYKMLKDIFLLKPDRVFVNSDLGINNLIILASRSKNNFVYEEGWGTYINKIRVKGLRVKAMLLLHNLLGSGQAMGNSKKTKGIFVYNQYLYQKKFYFKKYLIIKKK